MIGFNPLGLYTTMLLAAAMFLQAFMPPFQLTDGNIKRLADGRYSVETKEMRATIRGTSGRRIHVSFTYLGPTVETAHLADGSVRHQFGVKLRAQDICNLVSVQWLLDHDEILVQVKHNPDKKTHEQCGDEGYITVQSFSVPHRGGSHDLTVSLDGRALIATADGVQKQIKLPNVLDFDGEAGLRSDNVRVHFSYEAD